MKKLVTIILILISFGVFGQKGHFGLAMGPAFPLKNFSATENYKTDGYASPGFNLSFEGNYIPTWYFGIGGALTFSTNYPNQDSMQSALLNKLKTFDEIPTIPNHTQTTYVIDNWSYVNILLGPTMAIPAGPIQINLKALIGLSIVMPPSQNLDLKYDDIIISSYNDTQNAKLCFTLGSDIIIKLNGNYSIVLGAEYFHTSSAFEVETVMNEDTYLPVITRNINIDAIHSSLGIAYLF